VQEEEKHIVFKKRTKTLVEGRLSMNKNINSMTG
jgi:hypothetical protein